MHNRAVVSGGSRGSVEPLDFEKTEMEHLNFLEFLEEKVLRKSLLSIRSNFGTPHHKFLRTAHVD